ncbi:MAG: putative translation initiation factor 2B subunit [Pelotomaculum thermopropionicum]|uniref:Putative translation initiation factor 2B subunit n=1 Tax=Pelotomaculum thermopropionicum TaxID=110500 RepID=A0A101HU95_9FIRM|nr:MAG: putative translation initiation factor 2B subunit [Pelotomaculum thermopropionicum]
MEQIVDISYLKKRVQELEERVEQLRLSRRVLMNLIERIEKDKNKFLSRLENENRKLHLNNYRYARRLLRKNQQIVELESRLQNVMPHNSSNK